MLSKGYFEKEDCRAPVHHGGGDTTAVAEGGWSHCIQSGGTEPGAGARLAVSLSSHGLLVLKVGLFPFS